MVAPSGSPGHRPRDGAGDEADWAGDRHFWDRQAARYDRIVTRIGGNYQVMLARLCAATATPGQGRILEVATGTGNIAMALSAPGRSIYACDLSPGMLWQASRKARDLPTGAGPTVQFQVQNAYHLAFPPETFQTIVCAHVLHVVPDPQALLVELRRVARPGARLLLPTYLHRQHAPALLTSLLLRLFGFRVYRRFNASTLRTLLQGVGLTPTRFEILPGLFPIAYTETVEPAA